MGDETLYIRHKNAWFKFRDVEADGNCMYYCLAKCPATPLSSVDDIRQVLCKMMKNPSENLMNFFIEYHKTDDNPEPSLEKWKHTVLTEREWGSNFESSLFGAIYGVDIRIVTNTPTGLEESDTRTLLNMYEIDSETMIPKNAPTFYLYLHKHTLPQQPTKKPNHFAILDPVDHEPPEGSTIYFHPCTSGIPSEANSSASTKELRGTDGNGAIQNSSPRRKRLPFSGDQKAQAPDSCESERRGRRLETRGRRSSIEMSALSNVLSEISTYDRSNVNTGESEKDRRGRRASMEDRQSWRNVMSEMSMMHQSEPNFGYEHPDEVKRGEQTRRTSTARERKSRRSEPFLGDKPLQERKLEIDLHRLNGSTKSAGVIQRQRREESINETSRLRSNDEKRSDVTKDQRRSRRVTDTIDEEVLNPIDSIQNGEVGGTTSKNRVVNQRPDTSERSERSSSNSATGQRARGSTKNRTLNDSVHRVETNAMRVQKPTVKDDSSVSSKGSKNAGTQRKSLVDSLSNEDGIPSAGPLVSRVSGGRGMSSTPATRDEESSRSRTSQGSTQSRSAVSKIRDDEGMPSRTIQKGDLDMQNHSRSNDKMRRREGDVYSHLEVLEATPALQPVYSRDEPRERLGRQRTTVPMTRTSRSPRRPTSREKPRLSSQQAVSEQSRDALPVRRRSIAPATVGPARSPMRSPRRASMSVQPKFNDEGVLTWNENAVPSTRSQPIPPRRNSPPRSARSGRRASLPVNHGIFPDNDALEVQRGGPEDQVRSRIESARSQMRSTREDRQKRNSRISPRPRPERGNERSAPSPIRSARHSILEGQPNEHSSSRPSRSEKEMTTTGAPLQGQSTAAWAAHFEGKTRPEERFRSQTNYHNIPPEEDQRVRRTRSMAS